uniref:Uncharacterized protein n=1 Tax=viral metagenome TaxID=1070528 RepID=A0A6M3Y3X4_9ZZZZ
MLYHTCLGWLFNQIGNIFFRLNGRLDGLHKDNQLYRMMIWAWAISYGHYDTVTGIKYFGK